ncbi:MAG: hypothetical protein Ct9H300mP30_1990 [Methanobacteriota archaeon]|nr:MAG: hypothetical protein Ct9H300mP30_1990 [Euryarchaeota archaeon]
MRSSVVSHDATTCTAIMEVVDRWTEAREGSDWEIDGIVIKLTA